MGFSEALFARGAFTYFSTVGRAISSLAGNLQDPIKSTNNQMGTDIYSFIANGNKPVTAGPSTGPVRLEPSYKSDYIKYTNVPIITDTGNRSEFFEGIKKARDEGLRNYMNSFSVSGSGSNNGLSNILNQIMIISIND
jgi:hypothetical protein